MGDPKSIAKRMKAAGLQKLRWYCQLCEKQCRDENGFKCHTMSEGHLRMMRVFAENSHSMLDEYSRDFEKTYMQILSHRHSTKRVNANQIYQEMIADKHHIHMNATVWTTLSGFCKYLGKEGKAIVEETEKGWFIQYIERDPKVLEKQAQAEARRQQEMDEEERARRRMEDEERIAAEKLRLREAERQRRLEENGGVDPDSSTSSASFQVVVEEGKPISIAISGPTRTSGGNTLQGTSGSLSLTKKRPVVAAFGGDDDDDDKIDLETAMAAKRAKSSLGKLMEQEQSRKLISK
jgi:DNA/RNA-binding protein KIN17